ncbi:hypothetical protein MLD38_024716 [Melastoma candidum]|uniref:Uncharacterized protein n=1 Tax=Melastoma candidum TaxID=119954 RepID=A0ACB9NUQ7_9MYRT|nr:hypothetical protein MLD38_024716 [Melastoma candidum]
MIKALPPPSYSRTAEILSRYRPIAPKPDPLPPGCTSPDKIPPSPYHRTLLPQFHTHPARTRKRGRGASAASSLSSSSSKRHRSAVPSAHAASPSVPTPRPHVFGSNHGDPGAVPAGTSVRGLVTLPLLPGLETGCSPPGCLNYQEEDFVTAAAVEVPEEKDLLQQLQAPREGSSNSNGSASVISPRPVRPVGSSIVVGCMNEYAAVKDPQLSTRKAEEVEEEVESEKLPAVISDSNGRVRLANSAYKEMVGQPECPWLDSVVAGQSPKSTRISGDVILRSCDENSTGLAGKKAGACFRCWVRIEWGERSVKAVCDVKRLRCESKDYVFYWRFHAEEENPLGENYRGN